MDEDSKPEDEIVIVRAELTEAQHRATKAAAAMAGETLKGYCAAAIMQRVERDKAAREQQQEG